MPATPAPAPRWRRSRQAIHFSIALVWFVHIGMDRMLGYGLKYQTEFKDTHLNPARHSRMDFGVAATKIPAVFPFETATKETPSHESEHSFSAGIFSFSVCGNSSGSPHAFRRRPDKAVRTAPHIISFMAELYAGTSGFAYPSWKPNFYPANLPQKQFLEHYAQRLNCVEVNYTFRRTPTSNTLEAWVRATPPHFQFALKAHMRLTHVLRLRNAREATDVFLRAIDPLRAVKRMGPLLFQLPPNFKCDVAVLSDYLDGLPPDLRYAFEFRHDSWLQEPVYDLLRRHNAALCLAESEKFEVPQVITADFVYYRLRKPEYSAADLEEITARARALVGQGKTLYLMFKHEDTPEGALNAERVLGRTQSAAS